MQPKDLPFPKYARDYFEQLLEQYELLLDAQSLSAPKSITDLITKVEQNPGATSWADVFALESAYLLAIPAYRLRDEVQLQRNRYRDVVGPDEFATYLASAQDLSKASESDLRGELATLGERIRYLYTFIPPKESIRNRLSMHTAWWTLGAIGVAVILFVIYGLRGAPVPTILVVMFAGILGGFLSVQQRLQLSTGVVDPLLKELELSAGWFSVTVVSPLSGGIFAVALYLLFVSQLVSGGLFPLFGSSPCAPNATSQTPCVRSASSPRSPSPRSQPSPASAAQQVRPIQNMALSKGRPRTPAPTPSPQPSPSTSPTMPPSQGIGFEKFTLQSAPLTPADYAKLLVWAFIAGFAERLVPDVLTRLTGQFAASGGANPPPRAPAPAPTISLADPQAKKDDEGAPQPA